MRFRPRRATAAPDASTSERTDAAFNEVLAAEVRAREQVEGCRQAAADVRTAAGEMARSIADRTDRRMRRTHELADAALARGLGELLGPGTGSAGLVERAERAFAARRRRGSVIHPQPEPSHRHPDRRDPDGSCGRTVPMSERAQFGYCQARIQARYATLPVAADWQRLAGARSFATYLGEARDGRLQPWVRALSADCSGHQVERGLRALATEAVQEVASWVPKRWQPAVAWVLWIPNIQVLEHLAGAGSRAPAWTVADPRWGTLFDATGVPDQAVLERVRLVPLIRRGQPAQVVSHWADVWRALWPACGRHSRHDLERLFRLLAEHLRTFRQADPGDAWELRYRLRERLRLDFHLHVIAPVTPFLYLSLVLLDLERLRGDLLSRLLFPAQSTPIAPRTEAN